MRRSLAVLVSVAACVLASSSLLSAGSRMSAPPTATPSPAPKQETKEPRVVQLPPPAVRSEVSVEEALRRRRSVRDFTAQGLTLAQVGQLAWAGQGITDREGGRRTAPSAGATYPLTLYVLQAEGVFRYRPADHALLEVSPEDRRARLAKAAQDQGSVRMAPAVLVIAGAPAMLKPKYGERADRFVCLEAGHAAQNVLLQAVTMGLAGVPVGAFDDKAAAEVLGLPAGEVVVYLVPVGHPAAAQGPGAGGR